MAQQQNKKARGSHSKSSGGRHGRAADGRHQTNGVHKRVESPRVEEALPGVRARREAVEADRQERGGWDAGMSEASRMMHRTLDGVRDAGARTANTVREHPIASSIVGAGIAAGVTALAIRATWTPAQAGLRRSGTRRRQTPGMMDRAREAFESTRESARETVSEAVGHVRESAAEWGEYAEAGIERAGEALKRGAAAVGEGVERGYEYTRETASDVWENHPLLVTAGFLALGVAAGMLLPATMSEQNWVGEKAGELTDRVTSKGRELLDEGRKLAGRVTDEAGHVLRRESDRAGLTPKKVAKKVKRIAGRVTNAVSEAAG
jgi:hypothetical protein